jgi:hypothetical protein
VSTTRHHIWQHDKLRVFISHCHEHRVTMGQLKFGLDTLGMDAFVAHDDIAPTREWQATIEEALDSCDVMVAWLTDEFPKSQWTDQEVGYALGRGILVVPVRMPLNPYGLLGKYQGLPGMGKPTYDVAKEIAQTIASHPLSAAAYMEPLVKAFAASSSFDTARMMFDLLMHLTRLGWDPKVLTFLQQSPSANYQIEACNYHGRPLPEVINDYVSERVGVTGIKP